MNDLGRTLVLIGLLIAAAGGLLALLSRFGLAPGRLPGDFRWQFGSLTCFVPLGTTILLSILLTLLLNLFSRFNR